MKKALYIMLGLLAFVFFTNGIMAAGKTGPRTSFSEMSQGEGQILIFVAIVIGTILLVGVSRSSWANKAQSQNEWKNTAAVQPSTKKITKRIKK